MTNDQLKRIKNDWEEIAKEYLKIELVKDTIYAFCSELAALRLAKKYKFGKNVDSGFSKNLDSFYFSLTLQK